MFSSIRRLLIRLTTADEETARRKLDKALERRAAKGGKKIHRRHAVKEEKARLKLQKEHHRQEKARKKFLKDQDDRREENARKKLLRAQASQGSVSRMESRPRSKSPDRFAPESAGFLALSSQCDPSLNTGIYF
ncbi:hypothetical protein FOC4_g10005841 [Fusarium odoratissimum]|uniref:Uncharacterized protein n=2 Tax=Fusarium oxysporum species complex TaxID=171631 RepID=N1RMA8_FUSC4|nr:hypothetical protein FOC4_g10005841 [Fusarium odoratissimum]TXB95945.1 hypothetical protein FocTR4_00015913 [Fusarium oxysporum f. sp. cubense]